MLKGIKEALTVQSVVEHSTSDVRFVIVRNALWHVIGETPEQELRPTAVFSHGLFKKEPLWGTENL